MNRWIPWNVPLIIFGLVCGLYLSLPVRVLGASIPTSAHARATIARVTPSLTNALQGDGFTFGAPIFIRIFKETRQLEVWIARRGRFARFKTYDICGLSGELGPKQREGDSQGPEGFYVVTPGQLNPTSHFHLSFNIGYPNEYDRLHRRTGDALMIHGGCASAGCFAMTDAGMEEIYALADAAFRNGQPSVQVHIFPFRLTTENMVRHADVRWVDFWLNLQEGHAYFEREGSPPNVSVRADRYIFDKASPPTN